MLKLRDKDLSSWLWYNKGDALPTAREITENLRRGTEYSAPADDERWISGEIIGCQHNADHIEFDLEIDGLKSLTRSEERGVGKEDVGTCRSRGATNT